MKFTTIGFVATAVKGLGMPDATTLVSDFTVSMSGVRIAWLGRRHAKGVERRENC